MTTREQPSSTLALLNFSLSLGYMASGKIFKHGVFAIYYELSCPLNVVVPFTESLACPNR